MSTLSSRICPACGGVNAPDAVFCANPACGKALGVYRYVREEAATRRRWHERIAGRAVGVAGHGAFLLVHVLWFVLWIVVNLGIVHISRPFDAYPFGLLGLMLSVEAILLSLFVLISQNGERAYAEMLAELDYEATERTRQRIEEIERLLREVVAQIPGSGQIQE